jgi:hypothetical protein
MSGREAGGRLLRRGAPRERGAGEQGAQHERGGARDGGAVGGAHHPIGHPVCCKLALHFSSRNEIAVCATIGASARS